MAYNIYSLQTGTHLRRYRKIFSSTQTDKPTVKHVPHPVQVSRRDLERFHELNPEHTAVRAYAERMRLKHAELQGFPSDEVGVIVKKLEHLRGIEQHVGTAASVFNVVCLTSAAKGTLLQSLTAALRENREWIARQVADRIEPDLNIPQDDGGPKDRAVIVSDYKGSRVASILRTMNFPEGVAVDVETMYEKGPDSSTIVSLFTHVATKYFFTEAPAQDASAFVF